MINAAGTGECGSSNTADDKIPDPVNARQILAGREKPDELGHRVRSGGIGAEEMEAFLKENPERAMELAKLATSFKGAVENVSDATSKEARTPVAHTTTKRPRLIVPAANNRIGQVVDLADTDMFDDTPGDHAKQRRRSRGSASKADGGRRVDSDENVFAETFPINRTPADNCIPFGSALLVAAVMLDGPMQREDKDHKARHLHVVKSAIHNAFDAKGVTEFEALEMDPDVSLQITRTLISSFCIGRVESSRVIMLATLARCKAWLNANLFGPGACLGASLGRLIQFY